MPRVLPLHAVFVCCLCPLWALASPPTARNVIESRYQNVSGARICGIVNLLGGDSDSPADQLIYGIDHRFGRHGSMSTVLGSSLTGNRWQYCQFPDQFLGVENFQYTVSDGTQTATATITIRIVPKITIADVSVREGRDANFTIRIPDPKVVSWKVAWRAVNYTASGGIIPNLSDYPPTIGHTIITFQANETQKIVKIPTYGDLCMEENETFGVEVASYFENPTYYIYTDRSAIGTIRNNDTECCMPVPFTTTCLPVNSCWCNGRFGD